MTPDELHTSFQKLAESWCDRRCYKALRIFLGGWPLTSGLTDDWGALLEALQGVRARAADELTAQELGQVAALIGEVSKIVYRR